MKVSKKNSAKLVFLLVSVVIGAGLLMPAVSLADHNTAHTIQQLQAQIAALMEQLKQLQASGADGGVRWCYTFNTNLGIGSRGSSVSALQHALNLDIGQIVEETGYFGEDTASGVTEFQEKYQNEILVPAGLRHGNGYVGRLTRTKLNQLYGCGVIAPMPIPTPRPIMPPNYNLPPVISGVKGPTALKVGETGTWSVSAYDPENGPLSYKVVWGDESPTPVPTPLPLSAAPVQQTTTFTHSYSREGNYTPVFYVTDNQGLSAKTSISVNVGATTPQPTGYLYLSPVSFGVAVGQQQKIQAFYQPPMPPCPINMACSLAMPAPYPVHATWSSSNTNVAKVSADPSGTVPSATVTGVAGGTTEIHAAYTQYPNSYTAKATVEVRPATQPSITVISPNGGEQWELGALNSITWSPYSYSGYPYLNPSVNPASDVSAYLEQKNSSGQFVNIGQVFEEGKASIHTLFHLKDPSGALTKYPAPGQYYVRVVNNVTGASDRSDSPFTLLPKPVDLKVNGLDGPVTVSANQQITASWTSTGMTKCDIHEFVNNGPGKSFVGQATSGSLSFYPTINSPGVTVGCTKPDGRVISDTVFYLGGIVSQSSSVRVVTPNGGEQVVINQPNTVTWNQAGLSSVSIALYKNDAWYKWVAQGISSGGFFPGNYTWTPSGFVGSDAISSGAVFKIYILGAKADGTGSVEDKSDAPFSIVAASGGGGGAFAPSSSQTASAFDAVKPIWWPSGF